MAMLRQKLTGLRKNEKGVVTFFIVILIMLLLTLITAAMVRNANREERQSLDRQLNSQAYYAAESGIRDVYQYIKSGNAKQEEKDCEGFDRTGGRHLSDDGAITYSCALYSQIPEELVFDDVQEDQGNTFRLCRFVTPPSGIDVECVGSAGPITLTWKPTDGRPVGTCHTNIDRFPPKSGWGNCNVGIIRANFMDGRDLSRNGLANNSTVKFLVPATNGGVSATPYTGRNGEVIRVNCDNDRCSIRINGVPNNEMFLNIRALYRDNNRLVVSADGRRLLKAQAVIDVTGKASDVLNRLQVRVPLEDGANRLAPHFNIQTEEAICKQLQVIPANPQTPATVVEGC